MLHAGERVSDRYVVIEQIAEGGMGSLWLVHHEALNTEVALKLLSAPTDRALKRFRNEAHAVARLRTPNIVQVLDYGEHAGRPYLVMELLKGEDLSTRLEREGRIPPDEALRILDSVAKALSFAHAAGVVHRDLKPANIFLQKLTDQEEIVKVVDFGVAKDLRAVVAAPKDGGAGGGQVPAITAGGEVVGTPMYMSPEQVWGDEVGPRSDVWAMGVVAYEMLTGKCPFGDESLAKIFDRIVRNPVPSPRDENPSLPKSVDGFFDRALARDPADRIASAGELVSELRTALVAPAEKGEEAALSAPRIHTIQVAEAPTEDAMVSAKLATAVVPSPRTTTKTNGSNRTALGLLLVVALFGVAVAVVWIIRSSSSTKRSEAPSPPTIVTTSGSSSSSLVSSAPVDANTTAMALPPPEATLATPASPSSTSSRSRASTTRPAPPPAASSARVDPTFGIPIP